MRLPSLLWFLAIEVFLCTALPAVPSQLETVPVCKIQDLEVTLQIADGPSHDYTLAANFRNVSSSRCALNRAADEPSFFFNNAVPTSLFKGCSVFNAGSLFECAPSRASVAGPGVILETGAVGHQAYSWRTEPAALGGPCVASQWVDNTVNQSGAHFQLLTSTFLKPICSPVVAGPYEPGPFPSEDRAEAGNSQPFPTLHIMADKDAYYERERAPFRVVIDDPGGLLPLDQQSCPMLLIRLRYPSGWTRIEEAWRKKCRQEMAATPALGVRIIVEMALEGTELALGDNEVEVSAVAKLRSRSFLVSSSAKSHWNVADPATIERKWGPRIKGLAVALALDKDTFELGHDIPLHIAMANFEAESSVFGSYPIWDPPAVGVELRDSCGAPVQPQEGAIWLGHGLCGEYQRGKIVPNEL